MEFFNIGGMELILILAIALVVLGPGRIVKLGRQMGDSLRKLSKNVLFREVVQTTDEIRNYPRKIMAEAQLDPADLDFSKEIRFDLEELDSQLRNLENLDVSTFDPDFAELPEHKARDEKNPQEDLDTSKN